MGFIVIALLTASVALALLHGMREAEHRKLASRTASTEPAGSDARSRRVCEATRSRIMRGGTVGPSDVEGWVVELALLRDATEAPLAESPSALKFVAFDERGASLVYADPVGLLPGSARGTVSVVERRTEQLLDTRLVLGGDYVRTYFEEGSRPALLRFSAALAGSVNARHAALFARCSHLTSHHVGAWFTSNRPGDAAALLVYFMGAFDSAPQLKPELVKDEQGAPLPTDRALQAIALASQSMRKADLKAWLASDGGMVAGDDQKSSTITFPFKDSNRASRASRRIARGLGLAPER
jgi:hypothetical protein